MSTSRAGFGTGTTDLVLMPGFISHIESYWEYPDLARWLLRLGRFTRTMGRLYWCLPPRGYG
jgi:hypothetical protein